MKIYTNMPEMIQVAIESNVDEVIIPDIGYKLVKIAYQKAREDCILNPVSMIGKKVKLEYPGMVTEGTVIYWSPVKKAFQIEISKNFLITISDTELMEHGSW